MRYLSSRKIVKITVEKSDVFTKIFYFRFLTEFQSLRRPEYDLTIFVANVILMHIFFLKIHI